MSAVYLVAVVHGILHRLAPREAPKQIDDQTGNGYQYDDQGPDSDLPRLHRMAISVKIYQADDLEHGEEHGTCPSNPNHATASCVGLGSRV